MALTDVVRGLDDTNIKRMSSSATLKETCVTNSVLVYPSSQA